MGLFVSQELQMLAAATEWLPSQLVLCQCSNPSMQGSVHLCITHVQTHIQTKSNIAVIPLMPQVCPVAL